jgi:signal transduction histidine kinase
MSNPKLKNNVFTSIVTFIPRTYRKLSISSQLLVTFVLIFISFFILQTFLNSAFFERFYTEREFERVNADLMEYVNAMNSQDSDYYDEMYRYTSENNAYSVIVNGQYRILTSSSTIYSVTIEENESSTLYSYIVPDNDFEYTLGEEVTVRLYEYNEELYSPALITVNGNTEIYNSEALCQEESCTLVTGTVSEIHKPNNLNYLYDDNIILSSELWNLQNGVINPSDYSYDEGTVNNIDGARYQSADGSSIVFIHNLKNWNWIVTVVPLADTDDIVRTISAYNYYAYVTAIVIIILWSFRISTTLSKPTQNIEAVAREIAQLNFNVEAHEYNNKENKSLSNSINLISRNLKETLETINRKNKELTELYDEQMKQVTLKKQLVSSISHELKTPLMIMQVTIQGILDGIIDQEDQEKELLNVIDEINKSSIMIQDMLQIYRLDDANTQLEISEFDLSSTVQFFINDFENAIRKYDFKMDINLQDDVFVEADHKLIKRVISNFLTNAIKYTPHGEKIYIEVSEKNGKIYFELTNYGVKIDKNEIDKIWLPFYRLEQEDTSRVKSKGSGIGLYLVSEILKAHNAEYSIANVKNGVKAFFSLNKKIE